MENDGVKGANSIEHWGGQCNEQNYNNNDWFPQLGHLQAQEQWSANYMVIPLLSLLLSL